MSDPDADFTRGLKLRSEGRLEESLEVFDALARAHPAAAGPRAMRGLTRCNLGDFERGEADLRAAVAMEPRNPDFHSNLGMVLFVLDRSADAEQELRRALALAPAHADALNNLGLLLRMRGDFAGAERAAAKALEARPQFPEARVNLAHALLARGRFAEAWNPFCARPHPQVNFRDPAMDAVVPHDDRLPAAPGAIVVHGEQGLGDTLFFLRFAPRLRAIGHRLAFWGDARLHPLLARTGDFEHFMQPKSVPAAGLAVIWAGDLPRLLGAADPAEFPAPLPLAPDAGRMEAMRGRLQGAGPPPYIGLTWRAGLARTGQVVLSKAIAIEALAGALAGLPGTWISLQRAPGEGEMARWAEALGAPVHDAASANDDLEEALALVASLDEYVGVSNTNTHLRAGAGRLSRVLVPWPPEWRWLEAGERSPWFPAASIYRQGASGDWAGALARLAGDLAGPRL